MPLYAWEINVQYFRAEANRLLMLPSKLRIVRRLNIVYFIFKTNVRSLVMECSSCQMKGDLNESIKHR